jgi:molecular chaperone DnaK
LKNINIGIDLGTTNSAIASYGNGKVQVHKNPVGLRELLPSVVSYRRNRILVGDKARERFLVDAENTFASFKRAMGTDKKYHVALTDDTLSPIELSKMILSELSNFVLDTDVKSTVITIPASFNTMQSNATKQAGLAAGFEEVVLLQEPIAACIAYSNVQELSVEETETWLVYDFGGGTFDASLAKVSDRSLEIIDHKGDNFLGGVDLDMLIIQKMICPAIEKEFSEHEGLWKKMIASDDASYKKLYYECLFRAEEAKKELSVREQTFIEIESDDFDLFVTIDITREDFNKLVQPKFDTSFSLIEELLATNSLEFSNISKIIMVGGTTLIPYIREELSRRTDIPLDISVDPTQIVVMGAAYFAGSKESTLVEVVTTAPEQKKVTKVSVQWIFENQSNDDEELLVGVLAQKTEGFYRIIRNDGGYDTGMVRFRDKINEFLPLISGAKNTFAVKVYNVYKELIHENDDIAISQGLYNILGQPLPDDICLELDHDEGTYLEEIFKKNEILPLSKTIYKTASKTILKDSDEKLIINIVEGSVRNSPASNLPIGYIEISGHNLELDIIKGLDIELHFKMSESRDLTVSIFIDSVNLKHQQVFNPNQFVVNFSKVITEIKQYINVIENEIAVLQTTDKKLARELRTIESELITLYGEALEYEDDTVTEKKYQIHEQKRLLIQKFDQLLANELLLKEIQNYTENKSLFEGRLDELSEAQLKTYQQIVTDERVFLHSGNKQIIRLKAQELLSLLRKSHKITDEDYRYYYYFFAHNENVREFSSNKRKFDKLIQKGQKAYSANNMDELRYIINELYANTQSYFRQQRSGTSGDIASKLGIK